MLQIDKNKIVFLLGWMSMMPASAMSEQTIHTLVNLRTFIPTAHFDIRYATPNNFTHEQVYLKPSCYIRKEVAENLQAAQEEFLRMGLSIKFFDGFRPQEAQEKFWKLVPDERYVANPKKGSRHNRGAAVDITLVDAKTGKELLMPTEFDDFTEKAHSNYMNLPQEALNNRELLTRIMHKHGFTVCDTEWWHFDYKNWRECPLLRNVTFADLE